MFPLYRAEVQQFTFVLTDVTSQWKFGFCRRDEVSNMAMVIVTHLPWHDQFLKFMNILAEIKRQSALELRNFLSESYNCKVPDPGTHTCILPKHEKYFFKFTAPWEHILPKIPENHNLSNYYNFIKIDFMIEIFCAMLNERRIVLTSQKLDILSSCVIAAGDLIYPMTWQHIFAPILPMKLKEYVNAPMPYLIGVPKPIFQILSSQDLADVVLLDCDTNKFTSPFEDKKMFPRDILETLKKNLSDTSKLSGDGISRSFLRAIVQLIGGYRDGFRFSGDIIEFDDRQFIASRPMRLRPFLEKVLELQIFRQFIDARLVAIKDGFSDEFETETRKYSEKNQRKFNLVKNLKDLVSIHHS